MPAPSRCRPVHAIPCIGGPPRSVAFSAHGPPAGLIHPVAALAWRTAGMPHNRRDGSGMLLRGICARPLQRHIGSARIGVRLHRRIAGLVAWPHGLHRAGLLRLVVLRRRSVRWSMPVAARERRSSRARRSASPAHSQLAVNSLHAVDLLRQANGRCRAAPASATRARQRGDAILIGDANAVVAQLAALLKVAADPLGRGFFRGRSAPPPALAGSSAAASKTRNTTVRIDFPPKVNWQIRRRSGQPSDQVGAVERRAKRSLDL